MLNKIIAFEICTFISTINRILNFISVDDTHQCCICLFSTWEIPSQAGKCCYLLITGWWKVVTEDSGVTKKLWEKGWRDKL